jgi:hypothetical protein
MQVAMAHTRDGNDHSEAPIVPDSADERAEGDTESGSSTPICTAIEVARRHDRDVLLDAQLFCGSHARYVHLRQMSFLSARRIS